MEKFDEKTQNRMEEMVNVLWGDVKDIPAIERCATIADLLAKSIANIPNMGTIQKLKITDIIIAGVVAQTLNEISK